MIKIIKNNYLFLVLFLVVVLKEPLYELLEVTNDIYTPLRCSITENDYNKLLEFSEIDYIYESDYLNTYIIYKDIYNYLDTITIRGGKDYEFNGNPVIYDNTLIGIIDKVNENSSTVKLITNNNSKISVKINDELGLLEVKNNELIVSNISNYGNISKGDLIYTSGLGKIRENIYIGKVKDIIIDNKGIEKKIIVDYSIEIKDLKYVTVMKESL